MTNCGFWKSTLRLTNIFAPENGWLEDDISKIGSSPFSGAMLVSGSVIFPFGGNRVSVIGFVCFEGVDHASGRFICIEGLTFTISTGLPVFRHGPTHAAHPKTNIVSSKLTVGT